MHLLTMQLIFDPARTPRHPRIARCWRAGSRSSRTALRAQAVRLGLATEDKIVRLPDAFRAITAKGEHVVHAPTVTAIWTRVGG